VTASQSGTIGGARLSGPSPGVTENPASGSVQGTGRGPNKSSVETDFPLPLSDCTGS
jgi:hypothetical protein